MIKAKEFIEHIKNNDVKDKNLTLREGEQEDVCRLFANENPLGPSPLAVEAVRLSAAKGSLYPDHHCSDLKEGLSNYLSVAADRIIVGTSTTEILRLLFFAYIKPGDEVIVPSSTVESCTTLATLFGARVKSIPLTDSFLVDLPSMVAAISIKTKMFYFANPHNPTGTVVDKRLFLQMLHRIGKNILVVIDESYIEYMEDANAPRGMDYMKDFPNIVVLRTFSKALGLAGYGVGYGIGSKEVIGKLDKIKEPYSVNSLSQAASLGTLQDKKYIKKSIQYNKVERDYLILSLKTAGITCFPSQGNFLLLQTEIESKKVYEFLLEKGILVRRIDDLGYANGISVSIGLRKENDRFIDAIKILLYRIRNEV